ncbi:DUF2946 family protein [Rhodoferax sp.]|uniref:DUF2946 family protein n=1 Tax=Rhodoferax sp. TaxID=50421 RepID=UPI0025E6455B|nr:DUF2946 family protein [Rhodoferax sp.]
MFTLRLSHSLPAYRRWAVWLMLCAVLVGAALPTVSRAVAWSGGGNWLEICSASGSARWIRAEAATPESSGSEGTAALSLDHCLFCLQSSERGAGPPPAQPRHTVVALAALWVADRDSPRVLQHLSQAPPARGPPGPV